MITSRTVLEYAVTCDYCGVMTDYHETPGKAIKAARRAKWTQFGIVWACPKCAAQADGQEGLL